MARHFTFSWRRHGGSEVVALFRYDLDSVGVAGESTLVVIPLESDEPGTCVSELEKTADELAEILGLGRCLDSFGLEMTPMQISKMR